MNVSECSKTNTCQNGKCENTLLLVQEPPIHRGDETGTLWVTEIPMGSKEVINCLFENKKQPKECLATTSTT